MSKSLLFVLTMTFGLAGIGAGQARQIDVWGHRFDVDEGPTVVAPAPAPAPQSFKALAAPEPRGRTERPLFDLDEGR